MWGWALSMRACKSCSGSFVSAAMLETLEPPSLERTKSKTRERSYCSVLPGSLVRKPRADKEVRWERYSRSLSFPWWWAARSMDMADTFSAVLSRRMSSRLGCKRRCA